MTKSLLLAPHWSSNVLILFGLALIVMGFYFMALRPALLAEDRLFIGLTEAQLSSIELNLNPWLMRVFRVMGGFILGLGLLNITVAMTSFHRHSLVAAAGVFLAGLVSIALMVAINFQIKSDFRWVLLSIGFLWIASLGFFWREHRASQMTE